MLRSSNARGLVEAALWLSLVAGCATRTATPAIPIPPSGTVPPTTVTVQTEPSTPLPPLSVGPRTPEPARPEPTPAAPPAPAARPAAPVAASSGRFIVLNFDNADIETVIHAASEIVGFNYVLSPDVRGKVTVQTSGRIPQEDVFGVLLGILEVHGFTAVKSGNLHKIVRVEGARERAVPTVVGDVAMETRNPDEIITQIVPIRYAAVTDLGVLLRPFVSSRGTLVANRETSVLIITDAASNIRRVLDIIKLVDVQVSLDDLQIIPISFADATEVAAILTQLFAGGRLRAPGVSAAPAAPGAPAAATGVPGADRPPLIIAEKRSNSIVVHGRKAEIEMIRRVLAQLDINVTGGRRVFIYFAENAKAKDLTATLNAIYGTKDTTTPTTTPAGRAPGQPAQPTPPPAAATGALGVTDVGLAEGQFRFIADDTTNAIIVTATPRQWTDVEATIRSLDRMPRQVLIEVLVAEVTLTDDTRLGLDWAVRTGRFSVGQTSANSATATPIPTSPPSGGGTISAPSSVLPSPALAGVFGPVAQGLTAFTFGTNEFFTILNLLATRDLINVISSPHVMTSENKKAIINVSQSIPIVTSQQVPIGGTTVPTAVNTSSIIGTQSVEYKDAGVILTVTPRIGERGTVALDIKQEVNDIGGPEPPTGSRRIIKREAETSVVLVNNQTLVLGGLISDRRETISRGIPFLKDIPVLGYLFGFREQVSEKRELIILITPRVVGTPLDAARVTDRIRRAHPNAEDAIKRQVPGPLTPSTAPAQTQPAPQPAPPASVTPPPVTPAPAAPAPAMPPRSEAPPIPASPQPSSSPQFEEPPRTRPDGRPMPPPVNLIPRATPPN